MSPSTIQFCALCKRPGDLRNSHILPEFLYSPIYDEKHRAIYISSESEETERYIQKGLREYLLCQECETELSKYEGYGSPIIKSIPKLLASTKEPIVNIEGVDYPQFKLFQLSLLWRSSVSKNQVFTQVNLGKHQEIIRTMILSKDPGYPYQYGCMMLVIHDTKRLDRIIWSPVREKIAGHTCYRFMTGALFWYFFVSSHRVSKDVSEIFISKEGQLRIGIPPWSEDEIVSKFSGLIKDKWQKTHT